MDAGEQKVGSWLAFDTLLFTKKETEFAGCARDLPGSLPPASCLDMPQQPAFSAFEIRVPTASMAVSRLFVPRSYHYTALALALAWRKVP